MTSLLAPAQPLDLAFVSQGQPDPSCTVEHFRCKICPVHVDDATGRRIPVSTVNPHTHLLWHAEHADTPSGAERYTRWAADVPPFVLLKVQHGERPVAFTAWLDGEEGYDVERQPAYELSVWLNDMVRRRMFTRAWLAEYFGVSRRQVDLWRRGDISWYHREVLSSTRNAWGMVTHG